MITASIRRHLRTLVTLLLIMLTMAGCTLLPASRPRSAGTGNSAAASRGRPEEATPTPVPTSVALSKPTYTVARGAVTKRLILGGRIAPVTQQELFFRTSGRVHAVYIESGDMVKAGQLLADLEITNIELDLSASRLDLEKAQARLKAAEAALQESIRRAQANVDIAKENLAIVKAQDPTPLRTKAEVALRRAELARKQAQDAFDAIAWRDDRDTSPQAAALEIATLDYEEAQADYDLSMQDIEVHAHQVTIAQRQVDLAQITLDSLSAGVDPMLVNDVNKAQLAVTKLQSAVSDAQIVAPFDGQVEVSFILSEGTGVDAYRYVATVSDLTELEVRVDTVNIVPNQLAVGMPAAVSLAGLPGVELQGRIRRLPATGALAGADQDRALHIALEGGSSSAGYRSGDLVGISLVLEQKQDVLWLPPAAIRTFEGRRFVVIQDSSGQRRVDVEIGLEGDDRYEIVSGLTEGQIVVGQ